MSTAERPWRCFVAVPIGAELREALAEHVARVITSYSIHYTKLYDHVGIDVLIQRFSIRWRETTLRLMLGLSALLSLIVFYYSLIVVIQKWEELMPTVDITASVYYIPVLIAMLHSFFHS